MQIRSIQRRVVAKARITTARLARAFLARHPHLVGGILGLPACEDPAYLLWLIRNYPSRWRLKHLARVVATMPRQPKISIVLPVYDPPEHHLRDAIDSVLAQVYSAWELCIADDASTLPHVRPILDAYATRDPRIKVLYREKNGHISESSNSALEIATGEFVALLDHDDRLAPHALLEVAKVINAEPEVDLVYSDEDKLGEDGIIRHPYFKPDWSPDTLLTKMYTCHLSAYRKSVLDACGGFRRGYEGAQDYDLALRVTERTSRIRHIAKILYHWRTHPGSIAAGLGRSVKPYAYGAAQRSVASAVARRGETATVEEVSGMLGFWDVRYRLATAGKVSVVLFESDPGEHTKACLTSLLSTDYPDFEVLVAGPRAALSNPILQSFADHDQRRVQLLEASSACRADAINAAAHAAAGRYLVLLDSHTEAIDPLWLSHMVEQAQRPTIGAVGSLLVGKDQVVYHAGITLGVNGTFGYSHRGDRAQNPGYVGAIATITNYSAVSGECLMCRREVFIEIGGLDSAMGAEFGDVDLCLRLRRAGLQNIYLPHVKLLYMGPWRGSSLRLEDPSASRQRQEFVSRWSDYIGHDPCYNPNLTRRFEDFRISR